VLLAALSSSCAGALGFVLSNGGLMANFSIEGTKLSKLDL
jgi:lipid-binding SYLF domain-containing protein